MPDTVDSTNNYAMRLIGANKAEHGLTIMANTQTAGRGQRGNTWKDAPGESLLMTVILSPGYGLEAQPLFLAAVATMVADVLSEMNPGLPVSIKWPNDIIAGDKKAGGILIENTVQGMAWQWAVVGIGINLNQSAFPDGLPHATSLAMHTGKVIDPQQPAMRLRDRLSAMPVLTEREVLDAYNNHLYRRGRTQVFRKGEEIWQCVIGGINAQGQLLVRMPDGSLQQYTHGTVEWVWG